MRYTVLPAFVLILALTAFASAQNDGVPPNLALSAKATASSVHEDFAPENAIDGSLEADSRWIGESRAELMR